MRWPFDTQAARLPRKKITTPGWAPPPLQRSLADLERRLVAAQLRTAQAAVVNVPGAIKGERIFAPDTTQTRTVNGTSVNDIVKSGQAYDIEVPYNSPGIFVARSLAVSITFRQWVTDFSQTPYVLWHNMGPGSAGGGWGLTTNVSLYSTGTTSPGSGPESAPITYMWNLEDPRSGKRFADDLLSCMALLHPVTVAASTTLIPGGRLMFDTPWLLERDSQLKFLFRPITDITQSSAGGTENSTRNQAVRVRVELHGTRYFTEQDAMRKGAVVP